MESDGSSLLGYSCDCLFDLFFVPTHHEVSELIYDDDYGWHTLFSADFRIILFEVASIEWLERRVASLHLSNSPLESIECLVWRVDHWGEKMRDPIIDSELNLLGIHHDHTELGWGILIEERQYESVHSHRFA